MPVTSTWNRRRFGQRREFGFAFWACRLAFLQAPAFDGDKARTEAPEAGIVLVTGGLVDGSLPAELGLQRFDRQAVRLEAAVAAAFAYDFVDEHAPGRIGKLAPFPAAALLGGAGLHIDDRRHAPDLAQLALHGVEIFAGPEGDPRRPVHAGGQRFLPVHDGDDSADALGGDLARNHRRIERSVHVLAAGHRHGVVVENLVGHADAGGDRGADREQPRVKVRSVADVGENVVTLTEGRLADPGGALTAHVGKGGRAAIHPQGHEMAADPGHGSAALGYPGGGIVGAARTEVRLAAGHHARPRHRRFLGFKVGKALTVTIA